jgi:hypothetical protein
MGDEAYTLYYFNSFFGRGAAVHRCNTPGAAPGHERFGKTLRRPRPANCPHEVHVRFGSIATGLFRLKADPCPFRVISCRSIQRKDWPKSAMPPIATNFCGPTK